MLHDLYIMTNLPIYNLGGRCFTNLVTWHAPLCGWVKFVWIIYTYLGHWDPQDESSGNRCVLSDEFKGTSSSFRWLDDDCREIFDKDILQMNSNFLGFIKVRINDVSEGIKGGFHVWDIHMFLLIWDSLDITLSPWY